MIKNDLFTIVFLLFVKRGIRKSRVLEFRTKQGRDLKPAQVFIEYDLKGF
jgi:hypothetical protein